MHLSHGDCLLIAVALVQSADGHDDVIKTNLGHRDTHPVTGADVTTMLRRRNRLQALAVAFTEASDEGGLDCRDSV